MKRTDPTVSLLERGADGKPARAYVPSHMTDIRRSWAIEQERQRQTFENVTQLRSGHGTTA